jgi:hypothetical protein
MARPQPNQPDPDDLWAACDEQPPGISIRPLRHGDLQTLLAHLDHDQDDGLPTGPPQRRPGGPVVAVRVRARVGQPGASAHAEYRRRRAAERARWTRGLPWRAGAVLAAGVTAGLLAAQVAPDLAGLLAVVAAVGLGWRLRFRPSADTRPGGAGPPASGAPPACSPPWSTVAGRCCTTWPSPAPRPTSITWSSAQAGYW